MLDTVEAVEAAKAAALRTANEVRAKLGLSPVDHLYKGRRGSEPSCPITNTVYDEDLDREVYFVETGDGVKVYRTSSESIEETVVIYDIDEPTANFIALFDSGKIPELVE